MSPFDRLVQWSMLCLIPCCAVRAVGQEQFHGLLAATKSGIMQRCVTMIVFGIDTCSPRQKEFHRIFVSACSIMQWRIAFGIRRIEIRTARTKKFHHVPVARARCIMQGRYPSLILCIDVGPFAQEVIRQVDIILPNSQM